MISLLRVDEKLLHGAVVFSWVENLRIQSILIADDAIASDQFMCMTFGLSKPPNVKLTILGVREAGEVMKAHQYDALRMMVIVGNLQNARTLMEETSSLHSLNVGYLHEFGEGMRIHEGVCLNDEERAICDTFVQAGIQVEFRQRYGDSMIRYGEQR